ncbi:MAG: efflux RND transporter periplasmic adaptor subunit [Candidatus Krumholzibacteriia bacterium]
MKTCNFRTTNPLAMLALLGALLVVPTPSLFAQEHDDDHSGHEAEEEHADTVILSDAEMQEFGIVESTAGPATIRQMLDLPGEIQANDTRLAHIVPRFSGIVTDVRAQIGDHVTPGQVLAVIESDESLSPFEMKTLIAGTIIEKHITLGEAVSRDHAAFVVADLSTVWADITVYQRDLPHVVTGHRVLIAGGHELPSVFGDISYVAPVVDEQTRTALARAVLPNSEGTWRPGMFITAQVAVDEFEVPVAVPSTALQTIDGQEVIFVRTDEGFAPRPVTVGRSDDERVEIVSGLDAGERYISLGGFTLKAELGKESLSGGHAH